MATLSAPRDEPVVAATPKSDDPPRMSETDIASQVQRLREEAYERDYTIHKKWQDCYAAYRNQENFDDKAPWQSRLAFTKGYSAVKQFVANIFKLLLSSEQWVTVEPGEPNPMQKVTAPMVEGVVLKLADSDSIRTELRDALEFGAVIGTLALRVEWEYRNRTDLSSDLPRDGSTIPSNIGNDSGLAIRQRKEGRLNVTSVDPFHLWWGPRTRGRREIDWIIEESFADLASLKAAGGFKNLNNISSDTPDPTTITQSYEQQRKDKRLAPETIRKQVHLIEFWGDLIDPKSKVITSPNRHVIIANKTTVIKDEPNPYWDGKPPYILASPLIVAGRWPGQGVLEMSLSLLKEVNEVARKMSDYLSYSVVPMLEVEAQALENPEGDMQTGIQPGKVWYRRSGAGMQAVMGIQMPQLSNASFNFELALDKEVQRGTFITEAVQGLIDAKGETTATEVQATIQQATSLIADIATTLDDVLLTPLAEAIWSRAFQFIDATSRPTWTELVGEEIGTQLDQLPREMRVAIIQGRYNFKAQGLGRAIQRQQNINRYIQFVQTVVAGAPQFIPLINMPAFFERIFEGYHFPNPHELVPANVQEVYAQMQQALVNQQDPVVAEQARAAGGSAVASAQGDQAAQQQLIEAALAQLQPQKPAA